MKPLLMALALLLGAVVALQWYGWAADATLPSPPPASASAAGSGETDNAGLPELALEPPPQEDYASVVERPLFLPERRPPPEEEEEPMAEEAPVTELDGVDLTAVVITPAVVSAWVRSPGNAELQRLRLGDDFLGWTVKTIQPDELVLERQGETNRLSLRDYENAPAPIPPTRLPPRRQERDAQRDQPRRQPVARRGPGTQQNDAAGSSGRPADDADARQTTGRQQGVRRGRPVPIRQTPTRPPTRRRDATTTGQ
jgi:general secretion pathway protein N